MNLPCTKILYMFLHRFSDLLPALRKNFNTELAANFFLYRSVPQSLLPVLYCSYWHARPYHSDGHACYHFYQEVTLN